MIGYILLIEELPRNKFTLFQEPYKNQSSDKADYPLVIVAFIICLCRDIVWKRNNLNCPSIPIWQFLIECLGKYLYRETLKKIFHILDSTQFIQVFIGRIASDSLAKIVRIATRVRISTGNITVIFTDRELDFNQRETVIVRVIFWNEDNQSSVLFFSCKHTEGIFRQSHASIMGRMVFDFIDHEV